MIIGRYRIRWGQLPKSGKNLMILLNWRIARSRGKWLALMAQFSRGTCVSMFILLWPKEEVGSFDEKGKAPKAPAHPGICCERMVSACHE
jgi:hypothetical protein